MLCLSEFYFLNRSSAKESANSSTEVTCDHDKDKLIEYKVTVTELETQVANVQSLPSARRIEEMKEELYRLEEEYTANLKRESKNYREKISQLSREILNVKRCYSSHSLGS